MHPGNAKIPLSPGTGKSFLSEIQGQIAGKVRYDPF